MLKKKSSKNLLFLNISKQIEEIEIKKNKLIELQDKLSEWRQKATNIQSQFSFILPNYIISEIIENEVKKDYLNLYYLINCAVINGRISEDEGKKIKQVYLL